MRAFTDPTTFDVGLAYAGGVQAWRNGHPEIVSSWISTPFLALVMALISRVLSVGSVSRLITALNCLTVFTAAAFVWGGLRFRASVGWCWATLLLALTFAPLSSSLWWKQFNIVVFGLALAGFCLVRYRPKASVFPAVLMAVSIVVKPIIFLLPLALVLRSETRRIGALTVAFTAALLGIGQAFLALRSGRIADLLPSALLRAVSVRTAPENFWVCHNENFSPQSLLCRLIGNHYWPAQQVVVLVGVLFFAALTASVLRQRRADDWGVFAFACLLSPMFSPIAWSHYQLLLMPMFLVLAYEFRAGASPGLWFGLSVAYVLADLVWQPYGTLPGAFGRMLGGSAETLQFKFAVMSVSMFAQYAVFVVAVSWYGVGHDPRREGHSPIVSSDGLGGRSLLAEEVH